MEDSLDLQRRVVGTRPGAGVAVDVVRNGEPVTLDVTIGELNLDAESRSVMAAVAEETSEGFGITLQDLTSQMMRRLGVPDDAVGAVVADVASGSTAEAGGLQSGDVILRVNRAEVASAAEGGRRARHHRGGPDGLPPATPRHARLPADCRRISNRSRRLGGSGGLSTWPRPPSRTG